MDTMIGIRSKAVECVLTNIQDRLATWHSFCKGNKTERPFFMTRRCEQACGFGEVMPKIWRIPGYVRKPFGARYLSRYML